MITTITSGSTKKTEEFLRKAADGTFYKELEGFAREGVNALSAATPIDSGRTSESWNFEIVKKRNSISIIWTNSDIEKGFPVAIMLQYGYATGTGGYVQGQDYINPAIRPIFDAIANKVWKAVTSA